MRHPDDGIRFIVKAFIPQDQFPGYSMRYFEYMHRSAADKKMQHFINKNCRVILMNRNYTYLEEHNG